ncbi:hypothetical protein CFOL_v3_32523, partial [Cephalotus follicularis]
WRNMRNTVSFWRINHNSSIIDGQTGIMSDVPMILATFSLRVVTKILLPGKPHFKEFFKCSKLVGFSVHTSSRTIRNFLPPTESRIACKRDSNSFKLGTLLSRPSSIALAILISSKGSETHTHIFFSKWASTL